MRLEGCNGFEFLLPDERSEFFSSLLEAMWAGRLRKPHSNTTRRMMSTSHKKRGTWPQLPDGPGCRKWMMQLQQLSPNARPFTGNITDGHEPDPGGVLMQKMPTGHATSELAGGDSHSGPNFRCRVGNECNQGYTGAGVPVS